MASMTITYSNGQIHAYSLGSDVREAEQEFKGRVIDEIAWYRNNMSEVDVNGGNEITIEYTDKNKERQSVSYRFNPEDNSIYDN